MKRYLTLVMLFLMLAPACILGQKKWDSTQRRNVIKFNPTPMLIWGDQKNITFSYERLIRPNHSLSLQLGYLLFPQIADGRVLGFINLTDNSKKGVNVSFDYRYYPFSRNKRPAPDGLYIGGYLSYYGFKFTNDFEIDPEHISLGSSNPHGTFEGKLNIGNLGFELGYQFLFWKRVSVDLLLFGPSLSYYNATFRITGDMNPDDIDWLNEEVVQKVLDKFPYLKTLFSGETLKFSGVRNTLSVGLRYSVQIGFAF